MANKRLTDLTELTTPADNDFLYIVDVSDTTESAQGTSKKIRKDKVDSGASKENIANKQNDLTPDGTGTKYPTVDAVNAVLPTSYSKIVYVNATSPTTATIFDLNNPPVTNDNLLKNDTANLYIGTDASTWVYLTGTGYVTKTVTYATSNFNTFGTSVDAGNSKTSHITRSGPVTLTGSLNLAVAKISTTPNTSAGSYDILTRNSSTTALEKKLVSDFLQTTGNQSFSGSKTMVSNNTTPSVLTLTNEITNSAFIAEFSNSAISSTSSSGALRVTNNNAGANTSAIQVVNNSSGFGGFFKNLSTGIGVFFENWSSGIGFQLDSRTGSTGDLIRFTKNNATTTTINHLGEIVTMTPTASGQVSTKGYVDGKITQTITNGVTDKSPSEDAVFDALALKVGGGGTANYLPKFTASGTVGNSQIFDNGTNVGIGTASPFTFFTLNKSSNSNATASTASMSLVNTLATLGDGVTAFNSSRMLFQAGNGAVDMRFRSDYDSVYSGGTIGTYSSHPIKMVTTGADRLTITSGGSTLVNTTTDDGIATNKLQVNGNVKATQFRISALNTAPSSATDTGILGELRVTATHIYVCTATNTWVRTALTTW